MNVGMVFYQKHARLVWFAVGMLMLGIMVGLLVLRPLQVKAFEARLERSNSENLSPTDRDYHYPVIRYRMRA
mgnify:CR=1 FL=1